MKLAEFDGIEKDVFLMSYVEGDAVIIKAHNESAIGLECILPGDKLCDYTLNGKIYTFTISDIVSDITASIAYARPTEISLQVSSHTTYPGFSFTLKPTVLQENAYDKTVTWSSSNTSVATVDQNGRVTAKSVGDAEIKATTKMGGLTASCKTTVSSADLALPGVFTLKNGKKVRFARGNLRYTPNLESWSFFEKQYDYGHSEGQISLFTWGYGSWSMVYNSQNWGISFTDWGTQVGDGTTWRTLTKDEWASLTDRWSPDYKMKEDVTVCGTECIVVLPNDWTWGENGVGNDWESKYSEETPVKWSTMEAAGAVCLPASGYRIGSSFYHEGAWYYWFSTYNIDNTAYCLRYDDVSSQDLDDDSPAIQLHSVNAGLAVRLVTDVK